MVWIRPCEGEKLEAYGALAGKADPLLEAAGRDAGIATGIPAACLAGRNDLERRRLEIDAVLVPDQVQVPAARVGKKPLAS